MYSELTISDALATRAIAAMTSACVEMKRAAVFVVVDKHGELVALRRLDGANLVSITVAQHKAVTAARLMQPSGKVGGEQLANFGDARITCWAGGLPILSGGDVVGGIGVSGLTNEEDEDLARIGLAVIEAAVRDQ
jgi:glc operon protein GlcG